MGDYRKSTSYDHQCGRKAMHKKEKEEKTKFSVDNEQLHFQTSPLDQYCEQYYDLS